ncbi:hypothetical protein FQR65_LT15721 [Abscondita terminalis]|nr:hypothetical protein FQR65_LT15721 [Abscondita terminalis]
MAFKVDERHWEIITNFVENYPVVATGKFQGPNGKSHYRKLWEELTLQLNSAGLGQRSTEKWQKTWTDFKYTLKKKASAHHQDLNQTGGGPAKIPKLNYLEMRMLHVLGKTFYSGLDVKEMVVVRHVPSTLNAAQENDIEIQSLHTTAKEYSTKRMKSYTHCDHNYSVTKRKREEGSDPANINMLARCWFYSGSSGTVLAMAI